MKVRRFQKENNYVQYNGQKYRHVRGRNMGHSRKKRNQKFTRRVSEEYSRIGEMLTRLPGKRGDENRADYGSGRGESK